MKKKYLTLNTFYTASVICCIAFFGSCAPVKNVVYFENLQKDTTLHTIVNNNLELKIRKNDLLSISIVAPAPDIALFNGPLGSSSSSGVSGVSNPGTNGYLVDNDGNIIMYKLGAVHVEGLTRNELKEHLQKDLAPYLKDAVVTIRFLSNRVTMLGEVAHPQVITMQNEQISVLEAIGMSGDLTPTGRRDNILVIRETPNGKQFKRLNLNDNSIFYSSFFYLKPDDVVYVEPTKFKIKNTGQSQQIIAYALSGFTIAITLLFYLFPHK